MKKVSFLLALSLLCTLALAALVPTIKAHAAASSGQILFILDASSSMHDTDGSTTTRLDKAKAALNHALSKIPSDTPVGLRVYGATVPDTAAKATACQDTQLVAAPAAGNAAKISGALSGIQAKGYTLMGTSLQDTKADFTGDGPKTVILLSDGIDTCSPPDPCDVAKNLAASGENIKIDTLGLAVNSSAKSQLSCIASGGNGSYYNISNLDQLDAQLSALTAKEVALFHAAGTPIKGDLRIENAPLMKANTTYTDTITVPQELYYGFEAEPNQTITISVKGVDESGSLAYSDSLSVAPYFSDTSDKVVNGVFGTNKGFTSRVTAESFNFSTSQSNLSRPITKPTRIAFKIAASSSKNGVQVPLEIKVLTDGGKAGSDSGASPSNNTAGHHGTSPFRIVLFTLLGVLIAALLAFGAYRLYRKKHAAGSNQVPPTTPTTPLS